ncbi:MAG: SH3 domain-containing protein [Caldilineaceae bacterium]
MLFSSHNRSNRNYGILSFSLIGILLIQSWLPVRASVPGKEVAAAVQQAIAVVVKSDGATLFEQPNGAVYGSLPLGAVLTAQARSEDAAWLYVEQADGQPGWLAAAQAVAFGIEKLPVMPVEIVMSDSQTANSAPGETGDSASGSADIAAEAVVTATTNTADLNEVTGTAAVTAEPPAAAEPTAPAASLRAAVVLASGRLNIRSGPGTSYTVVGKAYPQDGLEVLAKDAGQRWLQIALPGQDGEIGWVAAEYVQLDSDMDGLPVSNAISQAETLAASPSVDPAQPTSNAAVNTESAAQAASGSAAGLRGTLVFQTNPGGAIYAYDLEDGRVWPLTHGFDPAISPDGNTVAFTRDGGQNGIYLISINGGSERLIFSGRSSLASPKWSPDGQWILFARGDEYWECRTLGFGTCVSGNFLGGPPGQQPPPGFSIKDLPIMRTQEFNLAVVDTNGDNYHDVAALETARTPDWNEAGIVYQSSAGIQRTADKPDAENTLVSFDYLNPYYYDPDWQPNGGRILFQMRGASHWEIYSINPDGSNMTNLTRPVTALVDALPSNVAPAWSPDGQHIVYASNRGADNSAGPWRLWVMDADGGNQHPLPLDVAIDYTWGGEQIVSWGP